MPAAVPEFDLNAPLAVEASEPAAENESVVKSRVWLYAGGFILLTIIILAGGIGYLAYLQTKPPASTPVATTTPAPTPMALKKTIERAALTVEILNGTGRPKVANQAASKLQKIGYTIGEVGNAEKIYKKSVVYLNATASAFAADIIKDIGPADQKEFSESGVDVRFIIGLDE